MATVTTTFFYITDTRATDRSVQATWVRPPVTSSLTQPWRWVK
jgi:hypothetical protein